MASTKGVTIGRRRSRSAPITRTVVAFVLDSSSSMSKVRKETLDGLNQQIKAVRAAAKRRSGTTMFGVTKFATDVSLPKEYVPTSRLRALSEDDYVPDGWTALYDAVAMTVEQLQRQFAKDPGATFLVITLTDGEENSSVRYARATGGAGRLAEKLQTLQATGRWTFSFIGANIDVEILAKELAVPRRNITWYRPDSMGVQDAFLRSAVSTTAYLSANAAASTDFFAPAPEPTVSTS